MGKTGYKCRNRYCPNQYSGVIGQNGWGKDPKSAECIPCLYANQMTDGGQTPEQVETVPQLMNMFEGLLKATGWAWQDVKDSYQRIASAR